MIWIEKAVIVTVFCRNSLQAAGETGLEASMKGVGKLYSLVNNA